MVAAVRIPRRPLAEFALSGAVLLGLRLFSVPAQPMFEICGFHWLTGRRCPLCGMTRAVFALGKGEWTSALAFHPLSPIVYGALVLICASAAWRLWGRGDWALNPVWKSRLIDGCVAAFGALAIIRVLHPSA